MGARLIGLLTLLALSFLWFTNWPLGITGEWTWVRISVDGDWLGLGLGLLQAAIIGALFVAVAWAGLRRMQTGSRREVTGWLFLLGVAAGSWLFVVQEAPPDGYRLSKAPWVLYYPSSTGYFYRGAYEIEDSAKFLANYAAVMHEGDVLHLGTHPPGLFLLYRAVIQVVERFPSLIPLVEATCPTSAQEALDHLEQRPLKPQHPVTRSIRAALWLSVLLTHVAVVSAIGPLFLAIRSWSDRRAAWKTVCFWVLIPSLATFLPKDDVLFTGLVAVFVWCWINAVRRRSIGWGALAGTLGWLGLTCSLVFLPIGAIALLSSLLAESDVSWRQRCWQRLRPCCGGLAAVLMLTGFAGSWAKLDLLAVWKMNYINHAGFYAQYPRTKWLWTLANVAELAFSLGMPCFGWMAVSVWRTVRRKKQPTGGNDWARAVTIATGVVWGLLWLSGKNSGEAARLWIPLMPFALLVMSAAWIEPESSDDAASEADRRWLFWLIAQAGVCLATVSRVSGFHFGN